MGQPLACPAAAARAPRHPAQALADALAAMPPWPDPAAGPGAMAAAVESRFTAIVDAGLGRLPLPGRGDTAQRWAALGVAGAHDLAFAKLYEAHADALAILDELGAGHLAVAGSRWAVWAAEPPQARIVFDGDPRPGALLPLRGRKAWCSGAAVVTHALATAWDRGGRGPWLVALEPWQPGTVVERGGWAAIGMQAATAYEVHVDGTLGRVVGPCGAYLHRPGFWHGGAGVAAVWQGAAGALATFLHRALQQTDARPLREAALGRVDLALQPSAALLRQTAAWIDAHPATDPELPARRLRLAVEDACTRVLAEVGRALGAGPYCRDAGFARLAADLPVFLRQSHGDEDLAAVGRLLAAAPDWQDLPHR